MLLWFSKCLAKFDSNRNEIFTILNSINFCWCKIDLLLLCLWNGGHFQRTISHLLWSLTNIILLFSKIDVEHIFYIEKRNPTKHRYWFFLLFEIVFTLYCLRQMQKIPGLKYLGVLYLGLIMKLSDHWWQYRSDI